jgi:hypothetical protein
VVPTRVTEVQRLLEPLTNPPQNSVLSEGHFSRRAMSGVILCYAATMARLRFNRDLRVHLAAPEFYLLRISGDHFKPHYPEMNYILHQNVLDGQIVEDPGGC